MGILGNVNLKKRTRRVVVGLDESGAEVALEVRAPRLQEIEDIGALFKDPVAPIAKDSEGRLIMKRDPKTGYVLKDGNGSPVPERNTQDPAYLKAVDRSNHVYGIALVLACLDDQITPTAQRDDFADAMSYYEAVWTELEVAGIDVGAFKGLSEAATALGAPMSKEEIEDARAALGADKEAQQLARETLGEKMPKVGKSD